MDIVGQLVLGLGLFFLGMHQVGSNLRHLSGPSFRSLMARSTGNPWEAGFLGTVFGALMQSATAVTFILVNMVGSGLITPRAALPVITWSNVGLTVLAFLATLNIHPLVAFLVGLSAIAAAMIRNPTIQRAAGVLLGVGLIFFGLETMGEASRPLVATVWFQDLLRQTVTSPPVAFLVGIALAAVLQSNTGSALLVITLAGAGAFDLGPATMLIYGANLGAIPLRLVLAGGMHGTAVQLVHFEDLFCLVSGGIMVALSAAEALLGVPLIRASVTALGTDIKTQLALVFLLSNLIPAVALSPFLGPCQALLARLWPATTIEDAAKPKYLTTQALGDPNTALDLLGLEIARVLGHLRQLITPPGLAKNAAEQLQAMTELCDTITAFIASLATAPLSPANASRLGMLRKEMVLVGYLVEGTHNLSQTLNSLASIPGESGYFQRLAGAVGQLLHMAADAAAALDAGGIAQLREESRGHGPLVQEVHQFCLAQPETAPSSEKAILLKAINQFELLAWMLRRLAKVLVDLAPHTLSASSPAGKG